MTKMMKESVKTGHPTGLPEKLVRLFAPGPPLRFIAENAKPKKKPKLPYTGACVLRWHGAMLRCCSDGAAAAVVRTVAAAAAVAVACCLPRCFWGAAEHSSDRSPGAAAAKCMLILACMQSLER